MVTKGSAPTKPKTERRWHAVSVKPGSRACDVAMSGRDRRWLSREAPVLPLPGCGQPSSCRCTYQHHEDRRTGEARRADEMDAFARPPKVADERRKRRNRRSEPES